MRNEKVFGDRPEILYQQDTVKEPVFIVKSRGMGVKKLRGNVPGVHGWIMVIIAGARLFHHDELAGDRFIRSLKDALIQSSPDSGKIQPGMMIARFLQAGRG
jgi:hypothetical protein